MLRRVAFALSLCILLAGCTYTLTTREQGLGHAGTKASYGMAPPACIPAIPCDPRLLHEFVLDAERGEWYEGIDAKVSWSERVAQDTTIQLVILAGNDTADLNETFRVDVPPPEKTFEWRPNDFPAHVRVRIEFVGTPPAPESVQYSASLNWATTQPDKVTIEHYPA